jgi:tetratricopeptide (TPR) repeat protein
MAYAYLQQGRDQEALGTVADTAAIQKLNVTSLAQATGLAAVPVRYALERGAWAEAANLELRPTTFPYAEAVGHFGRALGAAHVGKPENQVEARAEIEKMKKLRAAYLARPDQAFWAEQIEILIDSASGWLARAEGDDLQAEQMLRAGADLEDASEKHVAMENRVFPVREQLGYLLLELGRAEAALVEFQASLKSTPNRLRGYYGAARSAELAGYSAIAKDYQEQLRLLTANATGRRVEIEYARQAVAVGR